MVSGVFIIPLDAGSTAGDGVRSEFARAAVRAFIAGPENRLAQVAADGLLEAESPYNPLVFYGPTGTGKTLLAQGLAEKFQARYPHTRVLSTTGADFARDYAEALRENQLERMRQHYRSATLLVIDGLGPLIGKPSAQEELSRTLDAVLAGGGRAMITLSRSPHDRSSLSPGLASRLSAGLVVPLSPPGREARLAMLERLAASRGMALDRTTARVLADGLSLGALQLQGALTELAAACARERTALDSQRARAFVARRVGPSLPALKAIVSSVAKYFNIKVADLRGPTRRQAVVRARGVAIYLARQITGESLQQLGRHFGGRDHTTVMYAYRTTEKLLKTDPQTRLAVENLKHAIASN